MKIETIQKANDLVKKIDNLETHIKRLLPKEENEFDEEKITPKLSSQSQSNSFDSKHDDLPHQIREKLMVEARECARRMYKILEKEKSILQKELNNLKDE